MPSLGWLGLLQPRNQPVGVCEPCVSDSLPFFGTLKPSALPRDRLLDGFSVDRRKVTVGVSGLEGLGEADKDSTPD